MNEQDRRNKSKKKKVCTDCQKFTWVGVTQDKCERCEKQEPEGAAALSPMANKEEEEQQQGGRTRITGKDDNACYKCKVQFKRGDNAIACDSCKKWFHCGCGKCSINLFNVIKKEKDVLWFCYSCKSGVLNACEEVKKLREENKKIRQELKEFKEKNDMLADSIRQMEDKWNEQEKLIVDKAVQESVKRVEEVMEENNRKMIEKEEREKRRNNLIIFNLPESNKSEGKERIKEDADRCEFIFGGVLQVEEYNFDKIIRLGKKQEGKTRPTLVRMEDEHSKWNLISRNKRLRSDEDEVIKSLVIVPDLTEKQREEEADLKRELKMRRDNGEQCVIKRGRIVSQQNPRGRY